MSKLTFFSLEKTEGDRVTAVKYVKGGWEEKWNKLFSVSMMDRPSNELKLQKRRLRLDVRRRQAVRIMTHRSIRGGCGIAILRLGRG